MDSEGPKTLILKEGVFLLEDPMIGRRVYEFDRKNFPFQTEEGLDFIRESILDDTRVRKVIESCLEQPGLGFIKAYGPDPHHVFSFMSNTTTESTESLGGIYREKDNPKVLVVQLLPSSSRMVYYKASHLSPLHTKSASIGLLEVQEESLKKDHIERFEIPMKEGGLAIFDSRLGFSITQGATIMAGFAVEEELNSWKKMLLPGTRSIRQKVVEMSDKIRMNFEFVELLPEVQRDTA